MQIWESKCESISTNRRTHRALQGIAALNLNQETGPTITVVIFVSTIQQPQVADAREAAAEIQGQGIRLVLVAHGSDPDVTLWAQITGDASLVFTWDIKDAEPPNYQHWFEQIINCPGSGVYSII